MTSSWLFTLFYIAKKFILPPQKKTNFWLHPCSR